MVMIEDQPYLSVIVKMGSVDLVGILELFRALTGRPAVFFRS